VAVVAALAVMGITATAFATVAPTLQPVKGTGAFPIAFTSAGGKASFHLEKGVVIECEQESGVGKMTSANEGRDTIKFTGCKEKNTGAKCANAKEGEIVTKELKSLLAYTYPAKETTEGRETGVVLSPATGAVFAEFNCSIVKVVVKGSVIGVITPLKTRARTFALAIKQTNAVQEPSEYEAEGGGKVLTGLTCTVSGGAAQKCGDAETSPAISLTGEEAAIAGEGAKPLPEFSPHEAISVTGAAGTTLFEKTSGARWQWEKFTLEGHISGEKSLEGINIVFKKAEAEPCNNGVEANEMVWKGLNGRLGYINKANKEVGVLLEPATQPLAKCNGVFAKEYRGTIVARITPLNTKTTKFTLHFEQSAGVQNPLALEWGGAIPLEWVNNGGAGTETGINAEAVMNSSKEMEVRG
jgi:hypothetical protein